MHVKLKEMLTHRIWWPPTCKTNTGHSWWKFAQNELGERQLVAVARTLQAADSDQQIDVCMNTGASEEASGASESPHILAHLGYRQPASCISGYWPHWAALIGS